MEAYPPEYVEHNLPLLLISGLGDGQAGHGSASQTKGMQQTGTLISNASPECQHSKASELLEQFAKYDGTGNPWNGTALPGTAGIIRYRIKQVGRTWTLPLRKAAPQPQSVEDGFGSAVGINRTSEPHSLLSPLTYKSPVFPDGVFTPLWFAKHQQHVPALIVSCFDISTRESTDQDERIKSDINVIRASLSRSGFKCRFAAVLLSDQGILQAPQLEDRLSAIRRATGLDTKSGLFFMPPTSSLPEIATFVQSILATLQPSVVEYYRDLTKHARRKKSKGPSASPPASVIGTSQSLSTPGWNARYEVKQGAFAEFRQEMDVAERHFSMAIDDLFNEEGVFEATASWSPRWAEARLLCDALAFRVIRCQLWIGEPTGSVRSWVNYRWRMKDLIDRRGKGSQTYGWEAWEARWARMMAQLIERADLPAFTTLPKQALDDSVEVQRQLIFALPEKNAASSERLPPFELLHHPGYWHRLSALRAVARYRNAKEMPEEDRRPPSEITGPAMASRARTYDTYLVPAPHEESPLSGTGGYSHLADISASFNNAIHQFQKKGQLRLADECRLSLGSALLDASEPTEAQKVLVPLWQGTFWRSEDWNICFQQLLHAMWRLSARSQQLLDVRLTVAWEMLSSCETAHGTMTDLAKCLDDTKLESPVSLLLRDREKLSPLSLQFAFGTREGHVGEPVTCQLIVKSNAHRKSAPIKVDRFELQLGKSQRLVISHEPGAGTSPEESEKVVSLVTDHDVADLITTAADLSFAAGQTRVFIFSITFKEAQQIRLLQASIAMSAAGFKLEHVFSDTSLLRSKYWINHDRGKDRPQKLLAQDDTTSIVILPKPPKLQLLVHGLRDQFYVGEKLELGIEVINKEEETVDVRLSISRDSEDANMLPNLGWKPKVSEDDHVSMSPEETLPTLAPSASHIATLVLDAPSTPGNSACVVEAIYGLESDAGITLVRSITIELGFVPAFNPNFTLGPLLNPEPWPSYFSASTADTENPHGIRFKWMLSSAIEVITDESILIHKVQVVVNSTIGDIVCAVTDVPNEEPELLQPQQTFVRPFEITTQKNSLDDRRSGGFDASLLVSWSREGGGSTFVTQIPVTRFSIPLSEPRVLCTVAPGSAEDAGVVLQYHLENPSTHFLTFAVTMEASADFAFSGPKYRTLSLAPLSRHRLEYNLMVYDDDTEDGETDGDRWIWPSLQIVDSYYQKSLRVHAASPGLRFNESQGIGVLIETSRS